MSYKYSKGPQVIGDLKAADDAERNTLIDFGEDQIEFQTSGSTRLKVDNNGAQVTGSFKVTNLGPENEIVIVGADNALTSSNLLTIDSNNQRVGIGTSSPSVKLDMVGEASGETQIRMAQHNSDSDAPDIRLFKSRGTEDSPTAVANDDNLARVNSFAYDGSSYVQAGSFGWNADGTDGDSIFDIRTRVANTTAARLTVNAAGGVDLTGDLDVNANTNVSGNLTVTGSITTTNDISFQDNGGTFPTNTPGFFWDLNNDEARIYAKQPSSDAIDFVFKLSDNNGSADRYIFWVDDYRGGSYDRYPLVMHGDNIYMHSTQTSEGVPDLSTAKINIPRGTTSATTTVHKGRVQLEGDNSSDLYLRFTQNSQNGYIFQDQSDSNALKMESHTHLSLNTNGAYERLKIASGGAITFNQAYTFPTSDGSANQVLQTNGSGQLSFANASGGDTVKTLNSLTGASGDITHDCTNSNFFYHTNMSADFTPNFINLNMQNNEITEGGLILVQGGTGYLPDNFKVDSTGSAIYWEGAAMPTASTNGTDTIDLKITKVSNNYSVFARFSTSIYIAAQGAGGLSIPSNALMFLDASDTNSYNGSGTTWSDVSGQGKHATLVNGPSFSSSDKWFDFVGSSSQYATVGSGFSDFSSGASFFFVADLDAGDNWERLIDFSVGGRSSNAGTRNSGSPINVGRTSNGTGMTIGVYNPSKQEISSNIILNNTLASYCVTIDGANAKFYRNGSLMATVSYSYLPETETRSNNYIGQSRNPNDSYFDGQIAVIGIFNRDLSASEISDLHSHYDSIYSF